MARQSSGPTIDTALHGRRPPPRPTTRSNPCRRCGGILPGQDESAGASATVARRAAAAWAAHGCAPSCGPLGIEFRGYCVVFAAVFCDHPDRDQLDGVPILDEFGVVEVPHRRSLIRPDRAADQNGRGSLRRWCGAHVLVELGVDRALVGHPWRPGDHVLQSQLDPHHRAAPCPFPL